MAVSTNGSIRLAPDVSVTRLPFGGAVLINGRTLAIAECGEQHAYVIDRLLADPGLAAGEPSPAASLLEDMVAAGWLVAAALSD